MRRLESGLTLQTAQYEVFYKGTRVANSRKMVNKSISPRGEERLIIRFVVGVGSRSADLDKIRLTLNFVDANGYTKQLRLVNAETEVSGLRTLWSKFN